ncbi:TRAP transporter large permease subunit [Candidatus Pelagibacter sp.]|jgi:tripartite ATP-independent transporter DctM subunit|nr:TRAP transporter large permease subunit [Candidatus Pelagibacter bacterium]MDB3859605.1 TRAP transporter large permease subunit [Candidatus Pelagibacter sp.]MDA8691133.1 TRAP transporter large permease subunit [Candidatus Pelagibacter bacterium]MDA8721826.1 TRAP transporter large permease subunit [Candidatus Pelagibacter bacterium]MDB2579798.1 TRAP transporter large permease subunit [Candidatus Pelagibacter bacterium]
MEFEIGTLSIILIVGLLALISIGVPMGFASGFMGAVLVFLYIGEHALGILLSRYYSLVVTYSFLSVPLFIFMASLLERSNIARDLYDALNAWLRKTRGGVGVVTAIMATIMAAMSGIIGGEIVLLGLIALPQMLRLKYDQDMSIGIICASGSLGTMIPPSIVLIIYGLTTETSITMLFQEAIVPGLMISSLIIIYILIRTRLQPHLAPLSDEPPLTLKEKISYLPGLLPPIGIVIIVLGSIYSGITGITEAAGMGVVATLIIIFARKELTMFLFKDALTRTFKASGTILTITFGATVLAGAYSLAGGPKYVAETILAYDLKPMYLIFMMQLMFLVMGAFMDWVGIVLLAMPVFLPIVLALGFDPIWFGILFCVNMQVSFLSPPFGPAAFYLKSVAPPHISLTDIFRGFAPFIVIQLIVLACVMFFPEIMTQNFHEFVPKK